MHQRVKRLEQRGAISGYRAVIDPAVVGLTLTIWAWNAHRAGERRTKLQMPRGGLIDENFPEPR